MEGGDNSRAAENMHETKFCPDGPGLIADQIATHTASDIVLSAFGRNASIFSGVMDNTDVFFKVAQVALGDRDLRRDDDHHGNR